MPPEVSIDQAYAQFKASRIEGMATAAVEGHAREVAERRAARLAERAAEVEARETERAAVQARRAAVAAEPAPKPDPRPVRLPRKGVLTDRQREVHEFMLRYQRENATPPTVREIGDAMGIRSPNGVSANLDAIIRKGWARRRGPRGKGAPARNCVALPPAGRAACPHCGRGPDPSGESAESSVDIA